MERLKHIKNALITAVESQMGDLRNVDAQELGEVVDMVKDMEEAIYYCTVTKAMEEGKKKQEEEEKEYKYRRNYNSTTMPMTMLPMSAYYPERDYRDIDKHMGRMYYGDGAMMNGSRGNGMNGTSGTRYMDMDRYPMEIRDVREGRSPVSRKNYMESKELHKGASEQMRELEKYLHELSQDITEMVSDATPEEKAVLQQKLSVLASKIK